MKSVYLSSGIHGDELDGIKALKVLKRLNRFDNCLIVPCVNNTKDRLYNGVDLNRNFDNDSIPAIKLMKRIIDHRVNGFKLCLCLHNDSSADGAYIIKHGDDKYSKFLVECLQSCTSLNTNKDDFICDNKDKFYFISPGLFKTDVVGTEGEYLTKKCPSVYTIEFPPTDRSYLQYLKFLIKVLNGIEASS